MNIVGRIKDVVYIHVSHMSEIITASLSDVYNLKYLDEYSSEYFIDLAAYGESQFYETPVVTKCDKIAYDSRFIYQPRVIETVKERVDSILPF